MSVRKIVGNKIDAAKLKIETKVTNNIADIQAENIKNMTNLEMKLSYIGSSQYYSSYQTHTDILKYTLRKAPEDSTHSSNLTKNLTTLTLEGNTILQLHKLRDAIRCAYFQPLSTNNFWPTYK